jgi:YD repeat-containing protein
MNWGLAMHHLTSIGRALLIIALLALATGAQATAPDPSGSWKPEGSQPTAPVLATRSATITFAYDAAGRLTQADYGSKSITYTYDNAGNLLRRTVAAASQGLYLPLVLRGR